MNPIDEEVNSCTTQPEDVDYMVPFIQVKFQNVSIDGVLLDGGSRVNILSEYMYKQLNLLALGEVPFQVKTVDQRRV